MQPQPEGKTRPDGRRSRRIAFVSTGRDAGIAESLEPEYRVETVDSPAAAARSVDADTDCLVVDGEGFRAMESDDAASLPSVPTVVFSSETEPRLAQTIARREGCDLVYRDDTDAAPPGGSERDRLRERIEAACDVGGTENGAGDLDGAVLETAGLLMSAAPDEVDTKIEWGLGSIAEALGADRGVVYEHDGGDDRLTVTHEWHEQALESLDHGAPAAAFPGFEGALSRFEPFQCRKATDAAGESLSRLGYGPEGTFVAVPIVIDWTLEGVLVVDGIDPARTAERTASRLGTAGELIGQTLRRSRRLREIERQNERLERFASVISHDLKNPLNVIAGYADLARETGDPEHVDRIADAADRMEAILGDLRTLSREARDLGAREPVAVSEVAERACRAVDTGELMVETEPIGTVEADAGRLRQAFENLLRNAMEHGSTGSRTSSGDAVEHGSASGRPGADDDADAGGSVGRVDDGVTVRFEPIDGGFAVSDDGSGFDPEDRGRLFEEGYTGGDGTGLGLAIVRTVIEAHGWTIEATDAEDGGARFEIGGVRFRNAPR